MIFSLNLYLTNILVEMKLTENLAKHFYIKFFCLEDII